MSSISEIRPQPSRSATILDQASLHHRQLHSWIRNRLGLSIARTPTCIGHQAPWDAFTAMHVDRPPLALLLGPRGGGKSFLSALDTHLTSRWSSQYGTRILGGSKAQSEQIFRALRSLVEMGPEARTIALLLKERAEYYNGSEIEILAASPTSVRGPHVPSLKLDEVEEIAPDLREAALGMCMNRGGYQASVVMTSTWHRVCGPMGGLIDRAHCGDFPMYSFCAFEVLERCPDERSGLRLENCPQCPLVRWCHSERDRHPLTLPKAKRSEGHYAIDSLIQKARATSTRTFEADYLCIGPKADGLWFPAFDPVTHVLTRAEYDPSWPVHLSIDSGVFSGAVYFQVIKPAGFLEPEEVHVFGDYLKENVPAEQVARDLIERASHLCQGRIDVASTDPAGASRTAIGPTVLAEYERAGLRQVRRWPSNGGVTDGLALIDSFLNPADGKPRLFVHPRCTQLIMAMQNYRRARRSGQWQDYPEDPQHPQEDVMDALRGGLRSCFPEGRIVKPILARVPARRVI